MSDLLHPARFVSCTILINFRRVLSYVFASNCKIRLNSQFVSTWCLFALGEFYVYDHQP